MVGGTLDHMTYAQQRERFGGVLHVFGHIIGGSCYSSHVLLVYAVCSAIEVG